MMLPWVDGRLRTLMLLPVTLLIKHRYRGSSVGVMVGLEVTVGDGVMVEVGVFVGSSVAVGVSVAVGSLVGVLVGSSVAVAVSVTVGGSSVLVSA